MNTIQVNFVNVYGGENTVYVRCDDVEVIAGVYTFFDYTPGRSRQIVWRCPQKIVRAQVVREVPVFAY